MTYPASEQSKHGGKPVELFRYQGTYANFYYTSGPKAVSFQGPDEVAPNLYLPIAMRRSAVNTATQNDDNAEVTIDMPVTTDIIAIYGFSIAPPDLVLTIFRGHNPGQFIRFWSGEVENISVVKGTATIRVPSSLASALTADFPNVYFQTPCNHDLFDARCGIVEADWSFETAITAINGRAITVVGVDTLGGKLVGGEARLPSGERRMIIAQAGNVVTINYPFAGAEVDSVVTLATGCDLAYQGDCKNRYNNTKRYGGFPYIPTKNIFASGLEPGKDVADEACLPGTFEGWEWEWVWITQRADGPHPGADTILGILNTPDPYSLVSNDGAVFPDGPKYSFEAIVDGSFLYQRMKMVNMPLPGEYEVIIDPNNFYPPTRYSFAGRRWDDNSLFEYWTADGGAFEPGGYAREGTFTLTL